MSEILVGSVDWNVEQWRENFYPQDIPEDWLLGYYANEFLTTVLDSEQLATVEQREEFAEQLIDCHESFRPVLCWDPDKTSVAKVAEILRWLENQDEDLGLFRLAGVWISTAEPVDDLNKLREYRSTIDPAVLVSVQISTALWSRCESEIKGLKIFPPVDLGTTRPLLAESWLMPVSLDRPSRELAADIRAFFESAATSGTVCVLATQGYEDIEKLQGLKTIIRLIVG